MRRSLGRASKATSIVAVAAVLTMAMAGCARGTSTTPSNGAVANDPGITDSTITLGIDTPLSGPVAGPGSCSLAGLQAYFGAANAAGGIKFGDGHTRTVNIKSYDDAYDPAKAVSNFRQMISDKVFADVGGLGAGNNLAIMPIANKEKIPHVFLQSNTTKFSSDQKANPWTTGWLPTYRSEGEAFGKFLAAANKPITVATLAQNDDVKQMVTGLETGIKGSQVKIVAQATYEATDPTVDAQITKLAASKADVFFSADVQTPLAVSSLLKAQQLGWLPTVFLPANTSAKTTILDPGHAEAYPSVYTTGFSKSVTNPQYANDADVKKFVADMDQYAKGTTVSNAFAQCEWAYSIGATVEAVFKAMKEPTRAAFIDAVHGIKGLEVPLMQEGVVVDTTSPTAPAVDVTRIQQFVNGVYVMADKYQG
ncbi:ABC transporter substrate-binding protein [Parafrigoribacterium mesophilum]|uniref:ABC transporter substrate-binding protein n=1 Tax=Parafrigoribacterium mesophilum TaxID=433646 RepID=UPI0031FDCAD4